MPEDTDRRVRRSKRALAAALIDLTAERPYAAIQVRDITDRADVGYATFYRHYNNKDDLMLAVFDEVTSELEASASRHTAEYFAQEGRLLFAHVEKYEGLYRGVLQSPEIAGKLHALLAQRTQGHMQRHAGDLEELAFPIELAAHHIVASLIGLIRWWLERDKPLPVEAMARVYDRLIIRATWHALDARHRLPWPWPG
jgi:AcrR family transcriptional regulator